jgi:hypothetical protein
MLINFNWRNLIINPGIPAVSNKYIEFGLPEKGLNRINSQSNAVDLMTHNQISKSYRGWFKSRWTHLKINHL